MYRASFAALDEAKAETAKSVAAKAGAAKAAPQTDVALGDPAKL